MSVISQWITAPAQLAVVLIALCFAADGITHPGGLGASGCHRNQSSGERHCHDQVHPPEEDKYPYGSELAGRVIGVTDGDTIKVIGADNASWKVRLNGIDAPERGQPFGEASRKYLESLVAGRQVLVKSVKYDRYGRILGNVWVQPRDCASCEQTLYVNHAQVLGGMAWWYRYYAADQTEEDRGRFESAEQEARNRSRGLWSHPDPIPPWVWRRR